MQRPVNSIPQLELLDGAWIFPEATTGNDEQPMIFSADETAGVGKDDAMPVTADCKERDNAFTGKIIKVVVNVKPMGEAVKATADTSAEEAPIRWRYRISNRQSFRVASEKDRIAAI